MRRVNKGIHHIFMISTAKKKPASKAGFSIVF